MRWLIERTLVVTSACIWRRAMSHRKKSEHGVDVGNRVKSAKTR